MATKSRNTYVAPNFTEVGGQLFCKIDEAETQKKDEEKKEPTEKERSSWRYWLGISIACAAIALVVFIFGLVSSAIFFNYLEWHYNLSYSFNCLIICGSGILITIIAGLAISSVKIFTKKSVGWAIILTFFLFPGIFYSIYHSRGDNFDRTTGKPLAWVVPSTGKIWRQTNFLRLKLSSVPKFSPFTGEKLVPLSTEQLQKIKKKKARRKLTALPEYKIYYPGTYYFTLRPGEITEPGIELPVNGKRHHYNLSSKDKRYLVIFDDGKVYSATTPTIPPRWRVRFKIKALDRKEVVKLVITEEG